MLCGRLLVWLTMRPHTSEWKSVEHPRNYLTLQGQVPHRAEGEATLLDLLPKSVSRALDLVDHDLNDPLPKLGDMDLIVSSFTIHRCP